MIMQFIMAYWDSVLAVIAFLTLCVLLIRRGAAHYVKRMLFYLVTEAERKLGSGTGQLKYAAVTTWLYEKTPAIVKFFFTAKQIDILIEAAVQEMKEYLNSNTKAMALVTDVQMDK